MAHVELTPDSVKQLAPLPKVIKKRLRKILKRLEDWPTISGAKPLTGNMAGWFRVRTGDYRLRFRVQEDTLIVDKVGHRSKFYED